MTHFLKYHSLLLCIGLLLFSWPASAHKVNIFVSAEGNVMSGYVYYTGGGMPKQATVLVEDRQGKQLGELKADEKGEFSFAAKIRQDHLFVLELADGHRASFTVKAEELPETLASVESPASVPSPGEADGQELSSGAAETITPEHMTLQISAEELETLLERSISKHVRPLREQLDQYEAKIRLHDILGGIGYIIGLMGLGYFLSSRKTR